MNREAITIRRYERTFCGVVGLAGLGFKPGALEVAGSNPGDPICKLN